MNNICKVDMSIKTSCSCIMFFSWLQRYIIVLTNKGMLWYFPQGSFLLWCVEVWHDDITQILRVQTISKCRVVGVLCGGWPQCICILVFRASTIQSRPSWKYYWTWTHVRLRFPWVLKILPDITSLHLLSTNNITMCKAYELSILYSWVLNDKSNSMKDVEP
jgi:hypothetical protein